MLVANALSKNERRTGELSEALLFRDLVLQAGFQVEQEEVFWHSPDGEQRSGALVTIFQKRQA
jgi:hypothetical protein